MLTDGRVYTFRSFPDDGEDFRYDEATGRLVNLTTPRGDLLVDGDAVRAEARRYVAPVRELVPSEPADPLLHPRRPRQRP
jgi:hypothetical protein